MPFLLEKDKEMPNLTDDAIYLATTLKRKEVIKRDMHLLTCLQIFFPDL